MATSIALEKILVQYFQCSYQRIDFIAKFVLSVIQVKTVSLSQIATSLNPNYSKAANYRRIQRFMSGYSFDAESVARFVLKQLPQEANLVLSIDRTNWKFGAVNINILAVGVSYRGTAFSLMWSLLPKRGNSNQTERIDLLKALLKLVPASGIKAIVADREFIGQEWFEFLTNEKIKFHIRIRKNMLADVEPQSQHIFKLFAKQTLNQALTLRQRYLICGQWLSVTGMKLKDDDYLIIVTNANPKESLALYKERWGIEEFFRAIKKTGFDFETTHLKDLDKISTLLALVTIAFTWAHRMGESLHDYVKAIPRKKHGYPAFSLFRHGLDHIRAILNHYHARMPDFYQTLTVLTCR